MKTIKMVVLAIAANVLLITSSTEGQGTFVYDQQSQTNEPPPALGTGTPIQGFSAPYGQAFVPSLSQVGFVRLMLDDGNTADGLGVTMHVNLISGSIGGTIVGTSGSVSMTPFFAGVTDFIFPGGVTVTPGDTYFFTPVVDSGGNWNIVGGGYGYPGGSFWNAGAPQLASDLWFREGVIVPEPSGMALLVVLAGCAALVKQMWVRNNATRPAMSSAKGITLQPLRQRFDS